MREKVNIQVLSSFCDEEGTYITHYKNSQNKSLKSITYTENHTKVIFYSIPNHMMNAALLFDAFYKEAFSVDMLMTSCGYYSKNADIAFLIPDDDLERFLECLESIKSKIGFKKIGFNENSVKISLVGIGLKSDLFVTRTLFKVLAEKNIPILSITTSEIRISFVIEKHFLKTALCILHDAFELDKKGYN